MTIDAHKNFAYSTVATAPSPATSGTSLVVASGDGALFPAVPFNAVICPIGSQPTAANAEIVRVTARSTDTLTITRTQEGTSARTVIVGDQIFAAVTAKTLTDVETNGPQIVARATDSSPIVSSTVLVSDSALLWAVSGNSSDVWFFEAHLLFSTPNAAMDVKIGWATPPAGTTITWGFGYIAGVNQAGSGTPSGSWLLPLTESSTAMYNSGAGTTFAYASGYVYVGGTSGNVNLAWAQNTSDSSNLILKKGSHLRLAKVA